MTGPRRLALPIAVAAVVLGIATTAALAATMRPLNAAHAPFFGAPPVKESPCPAPPLSGAVVDVTLTDMGPMMGPGMMHHDGMMGMGMMRVLVSPVAVPAGPVSLRVHNTGSLTHEVVVLPLGAGQTAGRRAVGADGEVDETGSVGEASRTCGADGGDGIAPGSTAWTTVNLPPGRYEVLCNIPGHYGSGMYAELDVLAGR